MSVPFSRRPLQRHDLALALALRVEFSRLLDTDLDAESERIGAALNDAIESVKSRLDPLHTAILLDFSIEQTRREVRREGRAA